MNWSLRKHKGSAACYSDVVNDAGHPICCVHDDHAPLIAAAPELLECLKDAVNRMLGSSPAITELRNRSLAAITKATSSTEQRLPQP